MLIVDLEDQLILNNHCYGAFYLASHGYWRCCVCDEYVHRIIMNLPKEGYVDHINLNREDCRQQNLRVISPSKSGFNRKANKGKFPRGIAQKPNGTYYTKICVNRQQIYLGQRKTLQAAIELYLEGCLKYFGEIPPEYRNGAECAEKENDSD